MVMLVELQATCSALGYQEGNSYVKEPDCLETVKDLIRFLKREDESCDIRRQLGHAEILQNDLLQILKHYNSDRNLFEAIIRLLVNLTQPAVLCFNNHVPTDKALRNYYLEIETHLQAYKEAFSNEEVFNVLTEKLGELLKLDWEQRQEEDRLLIERILILIRNILHVPPDLNKEQRTDDDASTHDQIIWVIHCSGLEDVILYIASSDEERNLSMHILEIVSLMFREQKPDLLASAGVGRSMTEKEKDERELEMVREQERAQKRSNMMKFSTRHSRFGGTYVVKNMKSISDREVIFHKSQKDVNNITFDSNKKPKKKSKNRKPIIEQELTRRSTLSIRLGLKEFCVQFLESCYNPLMYAVKDVLNREKAQDHDETYYLWAMRFFMEFCRLHSKQVELVSETLSVQTFHYIQVQLFEYYEMMMMEKKEAIVWGERSHLALKAYQELLMTLDSMDKSGNTQLIESAKVIKSNIFYMMEFRDLFLTLLRKFKESNQSRSFLKDMVETTHLFLKMLEAMSKRNSMVVQTKKKKKQKRKQTPRAPEQPSEHTQQELEDMWDEISGELSALFQGRGELPTDVTPFDAASEVDVDQQRAQAMVQIQDALRDKQPGHAIATLRAAREVWPERDEFGAADISPEEEFMAMREIFMAPLPRTQEPTQEVEQIEGIEDENEIEEEEMAAFDESEQSFNFKEFVAKFAKPEILKPYVILLSDFQKNSTYTNHCAVKMLHRIGVDLGFIGMMFQASLFRIFQKILLSPLGKTERYKELGKYAAYVVRRFVEVAQNNDKIFMEMLFWKTHKEAFELVDGYGSYQCKVKQTWTEDQEIELKRLFEEYNEIEEGDVVDCIMERITDPSKTRGQILRELKKQGLISNAKDVKKGIKNRDRAQNKNWTEEEEYELSDLYEKHKATSDPVGNILSRLAVKRSKGKVIEKLLALGLVSDKKELYKKRQKKPQNPWKEGEEDAPIYDNWSDDNDSDAEKRKEGRNDESSEEEDMGNNSSSEDDDDDASMSDGCQSEEEGGDNAVDDKNNDMAAVITELVDKGYKDQIMWIQRGIKRKADEKEKKDTQVSVPIVPLTEANETAMEDEMFLSFLRKIGLAAPSNEQEAFWRIPGLLSLAELRSIEEGLTLDEDNKPTQAHKIQVKRRTVNKKQKKPKKKEKQKTKKKESARFAALRDMAKKRKQDKEEGRLSRRERKRKVSPDPSPFEEAMDTSIVPTGDEEDAGSTPVPDKKKASPSSSAKKKRRVKRIMNSDSDDSDHEMNKETTDDSPIKTTQGADDLSQSQKRPLVFDDSSEDEELNIQPNKRAKLGSGSYDASGVGTKKKSNDSSDSSDDDDDIPLSLSRKASNIQSENSDSNISSSASKNIMGNKESESEDSDDEPLSMAGSSSGVPREKADLSPSTARGTSKRKSDIKRRIIESDDSEEEEESVTMEKASASFPATEFTQANSDLDSDEDDHKPLRKVLQKRNVIVSDDDDD